MFNHLVALVHPLLDEVVPGRRPDDVEAGDTRLVMLGDDGQRVAVLGGEGQPAFFQERPGQGSSDADDHQVGFHLYHAVGQRYERIPMLESVDGRAVIGDHVPGLDLFVDLAIQGVLEPVKFRIAIDHGDSIPLAQRQDPFDRSITSTDHHDVQIFIDERVGHFIGHMREVFTRPAEPVGIALDAEGENDVLGLVGVLVGRHVKDILPLDDLLDHLWPIDLDLEPPGRIVPGLEDPLAGSGFKRHVAAEGNHAGLRHDVFFLLVVEDRIGQLAPFEDEDTQACFLGMARRA